MSQILLYMLIPNIKELKIKRPIYTKLYWKAF